jgi:dihydroorotate dehydrogenase
LVRLRIAGIRDVYALARPLLFRLDAERAHRIGLRGMRAAQRSGLSRLLARQPANLPVRAFGINLPNPVGLAAGLDKNGDCIDALAALGFGFIEIGTVTPRAQPGNPRPRLFRLAAHQAIINRMGFNNDGVDAVVRNVERSRWRGVLGINIGRNKGTPAENAVTDYLVCLERVYPLASYVTVNISSPNTPGLRDLQSAGVLERFIGVLREAQEKLAARHDARKPMLIKIAPDLDYAQLDTMADTFLAAGIDGVICTNTTLARDAVADDPRADQTGGLSGAPLFDASTAVLRAMTERLDGRIDIIGVGGILAGAQAAQKRAAGAAAVQLYSGLIYRGPRLIGECVEAMRGQWATAA